MSARTGISLIVAATQRGGIGLNGNLPWNLPTDMKYFKRVTTSTDEDGKQNAVIMGRRTWESIPARFRPLRGRLNIVLSRAEEFKAEIETKHPAVTVADSFDKAVLLASQDNVEQIFVIGGSSVYQSAMASPLCDRIYLTQILKDITCDTFFPSIDPNVYGLSEIGDVKVEKEIPFQFNQYTRKTETKDTDTKQADSQTNVEEMQYLNLVKRVIETGNVKGDRTGTGTRSLFGCTARYSLRNGQFPLLTTKRVFWRGVVEELLWLVRGCTDAKQLAAKRVHIWDANGSRDFLDNLGFTEREEGDLGPVYGHQWRHFGAQYVSWNTDYKGQGVDQLAEVINKIKNKPNDRRILMSAWNAADMSKMALPPCHVMCQFYVANGELSCTMYQRSCDLGLGVPFNIASYSLLTCMLAHLTGLQPGEFIHMMGDSHVYSNHVEPLQRQIQRTPRPFPTLRIARQVTSIDDFQYNDFVLEGYKPMKSIKMKMAV